MASKYVQVYQEIYNGNGVINERVRMVMRKHSVPLTFKSFLRMYQAWRNHNYGGEKLQDHLPEVRKLVQPTGQLDKLKYSLADRRASRLAKLLLSAFLKVMRGSKGKDLKTLKKGLYFLTT